MVAELVAWGALERVGRGRYRIGMRLWQLGSLAPEARTLRDVALAFLHDLLEVTHEVAHLVVRDGDKALYLERLMARPEVHVRSRVARRLPLYATGPGKILLAHAPDDVVRQVLAGPLPRLARNTIADRDLLDAALVAIRESGYCISREETTDGASSVAAPVRGPNGDVVAAISVVVPADRRDLDLARPGGARRRRRHLPRAAAASPPLHLTAEGKDPMTFLDRARWEGKIFTTGGWVAGSGGEYDAVEPATGATLARVGAASEADVHKAAEAAAQAQRDWAALPYDRRAAVLRRAGAAVRRARGRDPRVAGPGVRGDPAVRRFPDPRRGRRGVLGGRRRWRATRTARSCGRTSRGCRWRGGCRSASSG